jgi:diguanylate cyclase (GGDEF)-like protein
MSKTPIKVLLLVEDNQPRIPLVVLTGLDDESLAGLPMAEVFRTLSATSSEPTETTAELAILQIRSVHLPPSCVLIRRDGLEIPIEDSIAAIHDRQGHAIGAVIVFRDVSVARAMARQITHSAEHDFLTGLPNRMLLNDRISQAVASARRHTKQVAVLFLDLDGFKHINDSLGHPIGDRLLQSIATRLVACVRGADTVSRQGGDEFVVLLPDLQQPEDAAVMAGRILRDVAEPHLVDQHELHVTTSTAGTKNRACACGRMVRCSSPASFTRPSRMPPESPAGSRRSPAI